MPKIIDNVRKKLLDEARKQILEKGYSAVTVRSVASACNIGVGTVYNYFSSKEMLTASFMLEDWQESRKKIEKTISGNVSARDLILCIYNELTFFTKKYTGVFSDAGAAEMSFSDFGTRHKMLRRQLSEYIYPVCVEKQDKPGFLSEFIAEALLTWSVEGKSFDDIFYIIDMLIKN